MVQVRLTATTEAVDLQSIRFTASGSGDDDSAVEEVRLWADLDRDGQVDPVGDLLIGGPSTLTGDDGTVTFAVARTIAAGATEDWLLAYDFAGAAVAGDGFSVRLDAGTDVVATAGSGAIASADGAPVNGGSFSVLGRLDVALSANNPSARLVRPEAASVPVLVVEATGVNEAFVISELSVTALGSVDDAADLIAVYLHEDLDRSGTVTGADAEIAGPLTFSADDGALSFSGLNSTVPEGGSVHYLVSVALDPATVGGRTLQLELDDLVATGLSQRSVTADGLPLVSSRVTVGGALSAAVGPASPLSGSFGPDVDERVMIQVRLSATSESVTVGDLTVRGTGSGDDAGAISGLRLYVDVDRNGAIDPLIDRLLDGPTAFGSDDGTVNLSAGGRALAAGTTEDWLIEASFGPNRSAADAFAVVVDAVSGTAGSGALPGASGVPLNGATWTAEGALRLALSATNPPATTVQRATPEIPALVISAAGVLETFTVETLTLGASGSLDDVADVTGVTLIADVDRSGTRSSGDNVLAGPLAFNTDDGAVSFTGLATTVPEGQTVDWLVVVDLAAATPGGRTLQLNASAGAVVATGVGDRTATAEGLPLASNTLTVGGALIVAPGPSSSPGGTILPGTTRLPMMQLRLTATSEPISLTEVRFAGSGSGDETAAIAGAHLYVDVDQDGSVNPLVDVPLVQNAVFTADDGTLTFTFAARTLAAGNSEDWVVVYDLTNVRAAGDDFALRLEDGADLVATAPSGAIAAAEGAPVRGGAWTTFGALSVARAPSTPGPRVVRPTASDIPALALRLTGTHESFSFTSLTLVASGSVDDATEIAGVTLIHDTDGSGTRTAADLVLAGPLTFGSDDGSLLMTTGGATLPFGGSADWLVVVDFVDTAAGGGTLALTAREGDLAVVGFAGRSVTPAGLPISSSALTVGGGLSVSAGPANPIGGNIRSSAGSLVTSQLRLVTTSEPIDISGLVITAAGSGDDASAVAGASLHVDANRNGTFEPGIDIELGASTAFTSDDGEIPFVFAARQIPAGTSEDWIVVYDLSGSARAGDTFSAGVARADAFTATAPSGPIVDVPGLPVSGGAFTVLGLLELSRSANSPGPSTVARGRTDVPVLVLTARGIDEAFTVDGLLFEASGSLDDASDIDGFTLLIDADRSGTRTSSDTVVAGPVRAAADDGAVRFLGAGLSIGAASSLDLLVVADIAASAPSAGTGTLRLARDIDVDASGYGARIVRPIGAPISSSVITVGGRFTVARGPQMPVPRIVERGDPAVSLLQVRLTADTEPVTVTELVLSASGSGDDARGLQNVELFVDADHDGVVDLGEPSLGATSFTADDGQVRWSFAEVVDVGAPVDLLVRADITATPLGSETFSLSLEPAAGFAFTSATGAVTLDGTTILGPTQTVGGGFAIAPGPANPASSGVNQAFRGLGVLQIDMVADNEECTVESLVITAAGSIDDGADIAAVRLVRDVNDNGLADFSDVALAPPGTFRGDDQSVRFASLGRAIGMNTSERWLVVYDLSGSAAHQETFRARVAAATDVDVTCSVSGAVTPRGGAVEGNEFIIEEDGALAISIGPSAPPPEFVGRGQVRAPVLQIRNQAFVHDLELRRLAVTASASVPVADVVASVDLFRDVNQDGQLDRGDQLIAAGATVDASGVATFEPLALPVAVVEPVYLLVVASVAQTASPGSRVSFAILEDADAAAASSTGGVLTTGAPVVGSVMTVAGDLNVRLTGTATNTVVHNDAAGLVTLDFELSAVSESFSITSLTLTAEGTMDPAMAIASLTIIDDLDGDGRPSPSEPRVAEGLEFAQGADRVSVLGLSEAVEPSAARRWLVVVDLAGTAAVDETFALSIAANVDITAVGAQIGPTSPIGAPLVGPSFGVGGSLRFAAGPVAVPDAIVATNADDVPALQIVAAAFNEDVTVTRLSLRASGSLDDAAGVSKVRLLEDRNQNGRIDAADIEVASSVRPAGDDGSVTFSPLSLRLVRGTEVVLLATVSLSGAGTAGQTVQLALADDADVTAFGSVSGAIGSSGAPIRGATISLVGALNVRLGPASPIGVGVVPGSRFGALQLELFTRGEAVTVEQLTLRLRGSADDGQAVDRISLWRDLDGDGVVGDSDMLAQSAEVSADDTMVMLPALALRLAADAEIRLLAVVAVAPDAVPGGTIRVGLEANEHVRATGAATGSIDAVGAPIEGSAFTIVRPLPEPAVGAPPVESCECSSSKNEGRGSTWALWLVPMMFAFRRRS